MSFPLQETLRRRILAVALGLAALPLAHAQHSVYDDDQFFGLDDFEITPDGRFAVGRANEAPTVMLVFDLVNGGAPIRHEVLVGAVTNAAQDAVAVTNERAVVLGTSLLIADLTQPGAPLLGSWDVGSQARDLAISPNGNWLVVRGGFGAPAGHGQFIHHLPSGMQMASHPGLPGNYFTSSPFDVDSVVATDRWAVVTSQVNLGSQQFATRVTVWDLQPIAALTPIVVFETTAVSDLDGTPHDITLAPSGGFAIVRSEFEVGFIDLSGAQPSLAWTRALFNSPGPLGNSAMDSIEATDTRIATLSRWSSAGAFGAQIDVFDLAGNQWFEILAGDPHDFALTPSGNRVVSRTSARVYLHDLANLPATPMLSALDSAGLNSTHTSYGAGLDSVVATDQHAVCVARNGETGRVRAYDISAGTLDTRVVYQLPERPTDVELTPDGNTAWISGFSYVTAIDLRAEAVTFEHDPTSGGGYPWCDGLAVGDDHVVAFGYRTNGAAGSLLGPDSGWVSIIELLRSPQPFCVANPNSTGRATELFATGSTRESANDLKLWVRHAPPGAFGFFYYGDQTPPPVASGAGFQCVGGQLAGFPVVAVGGSGGASLAVDANALPVGGGALAAGTTWHFQFVHRDVSALGASWNHSQGLSVPFE